MDNDLERTAELYDNDNKEEVEKAWKEWKQTFEKSYGTPEEEERRKKAWLDTRALITEHNKEYLEGRESYSMGVNQFTDMLPGELPPMGHLSSPSEERG
ncbi:cystein proteinase inhibitor protein salarin-like [Anguilla rostrata]|uniref:cystein proteinase inhibitor protein salarin-like n=1 Tax=Anguilla rostrata TaxID=7938 RepID=UPI0030CD6887